MSVRLSEEASESGGGGGGVDSGRETGVTLAAVPVVSRAADQVAQEV